MQEQERLRYIAAIGAKLRVKLAAQKDVPLSMADRDECNCPIMVVDIPDIAPGREMEK